MELNRKHYARLRLIMTSSYYQELKDSIDLELYSMDLIKVNSGGTTWRSVVELTEKGRKSLAEFVARIKKERSPHHELAARLAEYLRINDSRFTYENIEFSNIRCEQGGKICVRPDVFSIKPTYNKKNLSPMVHEIKVSRSDFLTDIKKPEKRGTYYLIAEKVFYVAPKGMIKQEEIPEGFGFIEYDQEKNRFETIIKAKKHKINMDDEYYLNLIVKGYKLQD